MSIEGRTYVSGAHTRKIDAEQDAARIAVEAMGLTEEASSIQQPARVLQGKNGLQEYCVKLRINPPEYETIPASTTLGFLVSYFILT